MGRERGLEALGRIMTVGALQSGIMAIMKGILGPVACFGVANLTDTLSGCLLIGETTLTIEDIGVKEAHLSVSRGRGFDDLLDQLAINKAKRFAGIG